MAPVALAIFAFAFFAIVFTTLTGDGDRQGPKKKPKVERAEKRSLNQGTSTVEEQRVYVVESGDTLEFISDKTGVTVEELQALNPDIDPQALIEGQKIKLR